MNTLQVKAPAKINIGLSIIEKRADNFHNLETIFYPINALYDELTFEESNNFEFICSEKSIANYDENICVKTVKKIKDIINAPVNIKITLQKNIPMGAGLGGGSSDAAAVLVVLNKMLNLNFSTNTLSKIALQLGSDVPFFLIAKPAFGELQGEKLTPINFTINKPILLVNPKIHVSTGKAFANIIPTKSGLDYLDFFSSLGKDYDKLKNKVKNDFEESVFSTFPKIMEIKKNLIKNGAVFAQMTGSGSTCYGIFNSLEEAKKAQLTFKDCYTFICDE